MKMHNLIHKFVLGTGVLELGGLAACTAGPTMAQDCARYDDYLQSIGDCYEFCRPRGASCVVGDMLIHCGTAPSCHLLKIAMSRSLTWLACCRTATRSSM